MNMRLLQFLWLDLCGATLYVVAYFSVGFAFSGALEAVTSGYRSAGARADGALIYDVRSHGYLDRKAIRISGSTRLNPHTLHREKNGIRVAVIKGGLRAWRKAGLPVEALPPGEASIWKRHLLTASL